MRILIIVALLLSFATPSRAQKITGPEGEARLILEADIHFSEMVMEGDVEGITMAYTADAKLFPANRELLEGHDAIRAYWNLPEGVSTTYHKLLPQEIEIMGDTAFDWGFFEGTTRRADGSESSWRGKYLVVWKKIDGEWKIYLDSWNASPGK